MDISKKDWKLFRERLSDFRKVEAYDQLLSKEIKKPFIWDGQDR